MKQFFFHAVGSAPCSHRARGPDSVRMGSGSVSGLQGAFTVTLTLTACCAFAG